MAKEGMMSTEPPLYDEDLRAFQNCGSVPLDERENSTIGLFIYQ
jgi:hypothetical protein